MKPLTGRQADYFQWRRYVVLNRVKRQQQDLVRRRYAQNVLKHTGAPA